MCPEIKLNMNKFTTLVIDYAIFVSCLAATALFFAIMADNYQNIVLWFGVSTRGIDLIYFDGLHPRLKVDSGLECRIISYCIAPSKTSMRLQQKEES